jgi:hypothetical protein
MEKASFSVDFGLIMTAILMGYLIEKAYESIATSYISGWASLIAFLAILYLSIFGWMLYLRMKEPEELVSRISLLKNSTTKYLHLDSLLSRPRKALSASNGGYRRGKADILS